MRRTSARAVTVALALALAAALPACTPTPLDERCREWAPEVSPPTVARTAPPEWPALPDGDAACGTTFTGDERSSIEVVIVVTERGLGDVLDHFERELPESLPVQRGGSGEDARLWGHASGMLYAVEGAGERRYALVFQRLAGG